MVRSLNRRAVVLALGTFAIAASARAEVTLTERQVVIPTYLMGPPDPNPQFYSGGNSQGAQHRIYPYPMYDNLTADKEDKSYKMVYLENEYVKIGILPESGGKIFEAIDKTNNYDFFYHQHVIKPALISLLGAWISGGVEWDIPHHHRATSFIPVQYTTESRPDGSKTVWVGELELRDRTRWSVGLTLHPGSSVLEASFRMVNQTPVPVSMLCFSNVAVSVNDNYQVIFPPSTQHVTYHTKNQFTTWPIATTRFNNQDFTAGVDVSWYKAHVGSMSMFAWNFTDDFLAGYDHGKQAGTMAIADHNVVPGKKFWTWGNGPGGRNEDRLLTDSDGPYIELMVGAYSDNQPDYSWLAPYETREWSQYWYPFREIDGVKNANTDAAVNLNIKDSHVHLGFYATADHPHAQVRLTLKDQILIDENTDINPAKAYVKDLDLPAGADEHDLHASLVSDGKELVSYSPIRLSPEAMPAPVTPFAEPARIKTNEELYLAGLRNDQFRAPGSSSDTTQPSIAARTDPYWDEALKRDPGDIRVNTALGIEAYKGGRFAAAEKYFRTATARATDRYTTPKDAEPLYYLALDLKAQGKNDEAFTWFSKATWSGAWKGQAYFGMTQIASIRGEYATALGYVRQSLISNSQNVDALALASALLRHIDPRHDYAPMIFAIEQIDPLNVQAMAERWRSLTGSRAGNLISTVNQFPATLLEVAAFYTNAGLWDDAAAILDAAREHADPKLNAQPMSNALALYYRGYVAQKLKDTEGATKYFAQAEQAPADFGFPFQIEMIPVLQAAMEANPKDSHAPYYLGNLLYDSQPAVATALWQKSADLGSNIPIVYRNLAWVLSREPEKPESRARMLSLLEKAVSYGASAMVLNDLDRLYEEDGKTPDERLAVIDKDPTLINRDDIVYRAINLDILAGHQDEAITLLKARFYRAWEGGGGARYALGDPWVNANLIKGQQALTARQPAQAIVSFQAAQSLPENLQEAGANTTSRSSEINYWLGRAYEASGDTDLAKQAFTQAAATAAAPGGRGGTASRPAGFGRGGFGGAGAAGVHVAQGDSYFRALAMQKLGQNDQANAIFQRLIDTGTQSLASAGDPALLDKPPVASATRSKFADAHYVIALGNIGLGHVDAAKKELEQALKASPDHLAAHLAMGELVDN